LLFNRDAGGAKPSATQIQKRLDLLGALEGFAGESAAAQATEKTGEIRAMTHKVLTTFECRDHRAYFPLNQRIHLAIVAVARSCAWAQPISSRTINSIVTASGAAAIPAVGGTRSPNR
jgi:DNA-binding GntR family transcriptional regulator